MITIGTSIVLSVVISVLITKILAIKYFEIIDSYVNDMMNEIGELVELGKIIVQISRNEKVE